MHSHASRTDPPRARMTPSGRSATTEGPFVRWTLTLVAFGFVGLLIVVPLASVFAQALERGVSAYVEALGDPDALAAIRLTVFVAAVSLPVNLVFGLSAAWLLAKFRFRGRSTLLTLVDLPFAVSPVVAGLVFVLLFGLQGWFGPALLGQGIKVIFAVPGVVLATLFVTLPLIAREVLAQLESQGIADEEAARVLGASGWQTFLRVTVPSAKWSILYGTILSNARAMGEFGAVSVVSGHIRGRTNTMTLHVEILYNEYDFVGAFAVASLLCLLALATLFAKATIEWVCRKELRANSRAYG